MPFALFHAALSGRLVVAGLDLVTYIYPYRSAAARAIGEGRLPFWNPDIYGGVPFLANIQTAVLYPLNLLFVWIQGPQAITWLIVVHLVLAGLLMFAFCWRALALPAAAATIGALAFSAGGFALAQSDHLNQANSLAWMPGVLLGIDQAYRSRSRAWVAFLAVVIALQVFAGGPQEQYYTALLAAAWLIMLIVRDRRAGLGQVVSRLSRPLVGGVLGAGLAAIQLIPSFELSRHGIRAAGESFGEANLLALPYHDVIQSVVPTYSTALPTEWVGYVGLMPLLLGVVAVVWRWRDPVVLLLAGLAIVSLLVALGAATPVFWLVYHIVPGYALFRVPARALLVFTFAAALLAAIGTAEFQATDRRRAWIVIPAAGALFLAAFPIAWTLQHRGPLPILTAFLPADRWKLLAEWFVLIILGSALVIAARRWPAAIAALVVLAGVELYGAAQPLEVLKPLPAGVYAPDPLIDAALPADRSPYRSLSIARIADKTPSVPQAELDRLGYRGDFRYANFASARVADLPNFAMQSSRATIDGYDGGLLPLTSYLRFRALLLPAGRTNPDDPIFYLADRVPDVRLLSLLGVRSIVRDAESKDQGIEGVTIQENPDALPRAFMVHTLRPSAGIDADLEALAAPDFDVARSAVIARGGCTAGPSGAGDQADLVDNGPEQVSVRVSSATSGVLVISNVDYPGWRASVDGKSQPVLLVDGLLQGVCVPAGEHTVAMTFTPNHWTLAIVVSVVSFLLLLAFTISGRRRGGNLDKRLA